MTRRGRCSYVRGPALALLLLVCACDATNELPQIADERITLEPDLTIGLIEGDSAYLFGDIRSVAVDTAGRIYVGDRIGANIRVYDFDGRFMKRIAREGRGPGEIYGWPADITFDADGRLYVRDGAGITVFAPSQPGGIGDSVAATWRLPDLGNLASTRSRVSDSGEYVYPSAGVHPDGTASHFYMPFRDGVPTGDTIEVPSYRLLASRRRAMYRLGATDGRLLDGLSHVPFAATPVWDVTRSGTIISSDATRYELIETNADGDTLRIIQGPTTPPRPVPATEKLDSARALAARLDSIPVPLDQVIGMGEGVREQRLPETLPALTAIHVAMDGAIWVEQWPWEGRGSSRFYDVISPDGQLRARVSLEAPLAQDPPPFFGARFVVGVVTDPDTGVERVVRFTLPAVSPIER
jgi:hypothetical protein